VRNAPADRRQAEQLGDGCRRRDGTVARHGQDALHPVAPRDAYDSIDIREVDGLGGICRIERDRAGVPVNRDDPVAGAAGVLDRRELRHARSEEEQRGHAASVERPT
jgi:hypothetical protein